MRLYTVREEEYIVLIKYVVTLSILGGAAFDAKSDKQPISSSAGIKIQMSSKENLIRSDFGFSIGQIFLFSANNKNLGNKSTEMSKICSLITYLKFL